MSLCRTDRQLIDEVARVWVNGGGDADGIAWLWGEIKKRVEQIAADENQRKAEQ